MWLRRSISSLRVFQNAVGSGPPMGLLALMVMVGCVSGPQPASDARQGEREAVAGGQSQQMRSVPPRVLTSYEQAVALLAAGNSLEAELRFQEFLLQHPEYPGAHVNLAIIFASRGDDEAAANSLADALIVSPLHPEALNQLGMLLRRQGKFGEAEAAYMKAITARPDYALAHYNLGVLNDLYLQRLDVALQHYERYQELAEADKQVTRWIADLKRRISATQRTANVTE